MIIFRCSNTHLQVNWVYIALIIFSSLANASNLTVQINRDVSLLLPIPDYQQHFGPTLTVKYSDWMLTHQAVDHKEVFGPNVNLTGYEALFFRSLFIEKDRDKLPEWLAVFSREVSESYSINNWRLKTISNTDIYHFYHTERRRGTLFLIRESSAFTNVGIIDVIGDIKAFNTLLEGMNGYDNIHQ